MTIAHISNDVNFIDGFIDIQYRHFPEVENVYFALGKDGALSVINSDKPIVVSASITYDFIIEKIGKHPDKIILHGLNLWKIKFLNTVPKNINVTWVFYGYEVFHRGENLLSFLAPQTQSAMANEIRARVRALVQKIQFRLFNLGISSKKFIPFQTALKRIDFFAHWVKDDFDYLSRTYPRHSMKFINFCYSNNILQLNKTEGGNNAILGNSASYTNNHIDIINSLSQTFIDEFDNFYIPLSYSGDPKYIESVKSVAKTKLGNKAVILDTFLSKDEYFKLLGKVNLAIMGHLRPQAGGNIRFYLSNRINVAMFSSNSISKFLTEKGAHIIDLQQLIEDGFTPLTKEQLDKNQEVEASVFRNESVKKYYGNILYSKTE